MNNKFTFIESIIELKYSSTETPQELVGSLFKQFGSSLNKIESAQSSRRINNAEHEIENQTKLSGDLFAIVVGQDTLAISCIMDLDKIAYPGWSKFRSFTKEVLDYLAKDHSLVVKKSKIRYAAFLNDEGVKNKLNLSVQIGGVNDFEDNLTVFAESSINDVKLKMQITGSATVYMADKTLTGAVVDITASPSDYKALGDIETAHAIVKDKILGIIAEPFRGEDIVNDL